MSLEIIYEDDQVIVCYKPSGVPTQTAKLGEQDMVSLLKNHLYREKGIKKEPYVAVVHRLDQPVEGILVFAKTPFAARELSKNLQGAGFGKYYMAVLCGIPRVNSATLEDYLVKNGKTNTSQVCEPSRKDSKKAVLNYEVIATGEKESQAVSLVKVQLDTGRHHQIRVQMANMGCPICGDSKYGGTVMRDERGRQIALCAYRLEFVHPKTKKNMGFEIEPRGIYFSRM